MLLRLVQQIVRYQAFVIGVAMNLIPTRRTATTMLLVAFTTTALVVWAQGPPLRRHTTVSKQPLRLVPARQRPSEKNRCNIESTPDARTIESNGIPAHNVGRFPNRGNPHAISRQNYRFRLPGSPKVAKEVSPVHLTSRRGPPNLPFGVAVNGILFDPGTAEYWNGDRSADWNYEALGGAVPMGIDENHAHVQPSGAYHYHGLPTKLLKNLGLAPGRHSPLVGWAADGFPIYAIFGYDNPNDSSSKVVALRSSYRLQQGRRPGGSRAPGGKYDGTFVQDYEYVEGASELDQCNGRHCTTPEYPEGTYAYFLTEDWPVIPRAFRGTPVNLRGRPRGAQGPGRPPRP